ncbi:MAG: NADH-quinone oxidoreductase subunit C [Candidatus Omnitrophota bacterium]
MSMVGEIKEKLGSKITGWNEHSSKRIYFWIKPQDIKEVAGILFNELKLRFSIATGQDTPKGIEMLYHFCYDKAGQVFSVCLLIEDKKNPRIDSIASLFKGAEWIEREIWELLGVDFVGHPNLTHLLLIDEWPQGKYPLRHSHES